YSMAIFARTNRNYSYRCGLLGHSIIVAFMSALSGQNIQELLTGGFTGKGQSQNIIRVKPRGGVSSMQTIKSSWKVVAAALVGFLLGAAAFHTPHVNAQYGKSRNVSVTPVPAPYSGQSAIVSG